MQTIMDRWWLLALRGVAAIVFGILTFVSPVIGLFVLVVLFGAYALVDGVLYVLLSIRGARRGDSWGWLMFAGISGIGAGVVTLFWPALSALALLFVIAAWAVVTCLASIFAAIRLRKQIRGEWLLATGGVLSIAFGVLVALFPGPGALAVVFWIGAYAVLLGSILLTLAFRLRSVRSTRARVIPISPELSPV